MARNTVLNKRTRLGRFIMILMLLSVSMLLLPATVVAQTEQPNFLLKWGSYGTGDGYFQYPYGITVDSAGNVYVADSANNRIQKFTSDGNFITKWSHYFQYPYDVAIDASGNVYVASRYNNLIQKFKPDLTFDKWWSCYDPVAIDVDSSGNVYVAEYQSSLIKKFTSNGVFIKAWGGYGSGNGKFTNPSGIAIDASDNVYVSDDYNNNRIQKFTSEGVFVAKWGGTGTGNGKFRRPRGVAVDSEGFVYVADMWNHRIQKFTNEGGFVTKWGSQGTGDGYFQYPYGITVYGSSKIYVADTGNNRIQVFTYNQPPVADAGADQTVIVGTQVNLDGSGSYDPDVDPLTYSWSLYAQPDGSTAILSEADTMTPSLTTDIPGDYVIELVVNDGEEDSDPDSVTITAITTQDATQSVIEQVEGLVGGTLNKGQGNSLIVKLEAAIRQMDSGNTDVAINQLQAFIGEINALISAGILSQEEAQPLIDAVNEIITAL